MLHLSGPVPWSRRIAALIVWLIGLGIAAAVLVAGFFVGAALLGVAVLAGLVAWARLRWSKPLVTRHGAPRAGETIIDAEYVVVRRERP